jgi:hypothetical protein
MAISEKSTYKEELEGLVYSATLRNAVNNKPYDTPAMTLRDLQRLGNFKPHMCICKSIKNE